MFQPAKKQKLSEVAANQIIDTIRCGLYKNGDMLPSEKELIKIYKISRITIREALRILAEQGIIIKKQGVGSFVAVDKDDSRVAVLKTGTPQELWNIYHYSMQMRKMIEPTVAMNVAQMKLDEEKLQPLTEAWQDSVSENAVNIIEEFTPDEQFHLEIIKLMDNPILYDWIRQLQTLENTTQKVKLPKLENQKEFIEKNKERHTQILEAIKRGDGEAAYFYMKQHLNELSDQFEKYFTNLINLS